MKRNLFLLIVLIGLGVLAYSAFNSSESRLFIRPDVGGHGNGYLYYGHGPWTRRVFLEYEVENGLRFADLSPDGSKIAFKKDLFLYIYDLRAKRLTQVSLEPNVPMGSTSLQWSPDGERIGFPCQLDYGEPIQLCAWDLTVSESLVLTDLGPYGDYDYLYFGGWSADGKTIALMLLYPEDDDGKDLQRILKLDTDIGQVSTVLDSLQAGLDLYFEFALSPDGQMILFSANTLLEEQNKEHSYALYRIDADGSSLQRVADREREAFFRPVWSPDGRSFYVSLSNSYTSLPVRFDLSGRLIGLLPFQLGRELISWKGAKSGNQ